MVATAIETRDQKKNPNEVIEEIYYEFSKIRHGIVKGCDDRGSENRCFMSVKSISSSKTIEVLYKTKIKDTWTKRSRGQTPGRKQKMRTIKSFCVVKWHI